MEVNSTTLNGEGTPRLRGRLMSWPFIAITRPFTLLPPFVGIVSGSFAAIGSLAARGQGTFVGLFSRHWFLILAGGCTASILNAASNTLNQITEIELDRMNKPDRVLPQGRMAVSTARVYCVVLYATALALAWQIQPVRGAHDTFWCVVAATLATIFYSAKPVYAKAHGWWANITIAVPRGCLLKVAGWGCVAGAFSSPEPWLIGVVFMLFLLGASSTKDFSDLEGDRAGGVRTLAVRLGVERTTRLISPFCILPWLGFACGVLLPLIRGGAPILHTNVTATLALSAVLATYGIYIVKIMRKSPKRFSVETNHVSWVHMYYLMMLAQVGLVACYLV